MTMDAIKQEIRTKLGGDLLDIELDDSALEKTINSAFREIQRYIDTTRLATLPYKPCMDLSNCGVSSVVNVYRTRGYIGGTGDVDSPTQVIDPVYLAQWQMWGGAG